LTTVLVHLAVDYLGTDGMAGRFPGVRFVQVDPDGPVDPDVHGQVLVTRGVDSPNLTDVLDRGVEWVHCTGHGIDEIPLDAIGDRILTCARGATAVPIAEWVVAMLLTAEKRLPEVWVDAPPGRWYVTRLGGLAGSTVALLGYADLLAACRPGVHLVNVARGSIVDQEALRTALDNGQVGLASLDVCEPEPLPAGHWLYEHPAVRLSPHVSWCSPDSFGSMATNFADNLDRWIHGRPLAGIVDVAAGY
jgi:phosphoglycerate dehydrogenase-like enzyme